MPRNTSGTYTLPAGNPVVTATTISTTWANTTLGDLATEISDSASRSGKGGFTAPVRTPDGTAAAPGVAFTAEPASGLYRAAANDVRLAVGGVDALKLVGGGLSGPVNLVAGTTSIQVTFANGFLLLQGNRTATDTAALGDVTVDSSVARTAGNLFAVRNSGAPKLYVDYHGLLQLDGAAVAAAIQPASIWTAIGAGLRWTANGLGQFKDANGVVHLKGSLTVNTSPPSGDALSPLAVGFRPAATRKFAIAVVTASNAEQSGVLTITATGTSSFTGPFSVGDTAYVDGVSFLAEG